jgi:hypothetical protein
MKGSNNFGKKLTRDQMKSVKGGGINCNTNLDCPNSCQAFPNNLQGNVCLNHVCKLVYCP